MNYLDNKMLFELYDELDAIAEERKRLHHFYNVPEGSTIEREINLETGERAVTHYTVLKENKDLNCSQIKLWLETGRTHQIRVHMKHLGHPLLGDFLYNPDMTYIKRQALHSHSLTFKHPITKEPMHFVAPVPSDMNFC